MSDKISFESFMNGTLLGDSYVSKDCVYCLSHSVVQASYLNYKKELLELFGYKTNVYYRRKRDNNFSTNDNILLQSNKKAVFKSYRQKWYPNGIKIVPKDLILDPHSMALWFMDDGNSNIITHYNSKTNGRVETGPVVNKFRLYTDGFDDESQDYLKRQLLQLGIKSGFYIRKKNNKKYIQIWDLESKSKLKDMIEPYIIPSMFYKISANLKFSS
jgi:hypothetical protein